MSTLVTSSWPNKKTQPHYKTRPTHYLPANHRLSRRLGKKQNKHDELDKTKRRLAPPLVKIPPGLMLPKPMARQPIKKSNVLAVKMCPISHVIAAIKRAIMLAIAPNRQKTSCSLSNLHVDGC